MQIPEHNRYILLWLYHVPERGHLVTTTPLQGLAVNLGLQCLNLISFYDIYPTNCANDLYVTVSSVLTCFVFFYDIYPTDCANDLYVTVSSVLTWFFYDIYPTDCANDLYVTVFVCKSFWK